ncbi:MAG: hypothetical protein ACK55Z_08435, partial [bacterium]
PARNERVIEGFVSTNYVGDEGRPTAVLGSRIRVAPAVTSRITKHLSSYSGTSRWHPKDA